MSYSNNGSARGDLGFIPNQRHYVPNRGFFGSPGNPSKKGVALHSQTSKVHINESDSMPLTTETTVNKRTEWLEGQERRLTATVNEHRSEQQRVAEQLAASLGGLDIVQQETKRLHTEHQRVAQKTQQLHDDVHWVYGKTGRTLMGISGGDKIFKSLQTYRKNGGNMELIKLAPANRWTLLSYPMEKIDTANGFQYLMKAKSVHSKTGQITVDWAIVFEEVDGEEHRAIAEFSLAPH